MPPVSRKLLVEGDTDKRVIPYLIEANGVEWETDGSPVVYIQPYAGLDELLKAGVIEAEMRASGLETLGIVVDANGNAHDRWTQIKARIANEFERLPQEMPGDGLRTVHPDGPDLGVWIMPNNRFAGMLEDFLSELIPDRFEHLFEFAAKCVEDAADMGATFRRTQQAKARIHTWLAWQDEPGQQLHQAVNQRILDAERPECQPFVRWFRDLFGL